MNILIDWIAFMALDMTVSEIINLLGLTLCSYEITPGRYGYKHCMMIGCVNVYYGGRTNMGVYVEMSGSGCRFWESLTGKTPLELISFLMAEYRDTIRFSRLDLAIDDHIGYLDMGRLNQDRISHNYVSRLKHNELHESRSVNGSVGKTLYFGKRSGNIMLRIYDKEAETKQYGRHWIRVELQLRHDAAQNTAVELCMHDLGVTAKGILLETIRFVVPQKDVNRSRWPTQDYWERFTGNCAAINVCTKSSSEQDCNKTIEHFFRQYSGLIWLIINLQGIDLFLQIAANRPANLNPKYAAWFEADVAEKNRNSGDRNEQKESS